MEGEAELHFECNSLSDWMPSPSLGKFGGALRGKATAKLARGGVQIDLDLQGDSLRTGPFRLEHGRIEASLAAPILGLSNPDALSGNAVVSLTRPEYSTGALSVVLDEGACALALEGGNARFWNIVLKDSVNVLAGEIAVSFASKPAPLNGSLQLSAKDLSQAKVQVLGRPLGGALEASWVGTLANGQPEGRLNASGRSLSWGTFGLSTFRAQAALERGELAVSEGVLEWSSTESVRASGKVKLGSGGAYDLQAEAQLPNLERISPLFEQLGWAKTKVRGAMEARWSGTGSLGNPSGTGDWNLRIRQAQWEQIKLELFECGGHYAPGSLTVSPVRFTTKTTKFSAQIDWQPGALRCGQIALAQWGHPTLAGEFVLPLTYDAQGVHWVENAQISGQLSADKLDLATLLSASGGPSPLQGTVQFAVTLSGRPSEPNCTLRASGNGLKITQAPQFGSSSMTLEGRYAQGIVTAGATANTPFQGTIRIDASLPLPLSDLFSRKLAFENLPLQASLQAGPLNLAPFPKLWSGVRKISGSASLELKVNGSLQNPRWQGALKAECPLLHFASDRLPAVGSLTLGAEINQKEVRLTRLRADLGGGELEVQGAASFAAPGDPLLSFKAKAHELLVVRNSSLALRLNGDLFIKGPLRHAEISGSVSPTKSRVQRDIEVLPLNALRMEIPRETRVTGKPWFTLRKAPFSDWRFNVEVRTTPGDPVLLRGNRLRGSMDAEVRLEGTGAAPTLHGAYRSSDLTASLPFARIELSRGRIWYTRDHPFQPHVDFSAETEVRNHRIRLYLHGPANAPHISANSEPPEPEADLLTLIATGGLPGDSSENSQALTNRAASVLFQEFSEKVLPSGEHERFSALRRFSLDLGAINNRTGQQETRLTYRFMDNLFMIGEVGTGGDLAGRVRYLLRFR
jgi:autotransporter translocation and assembly factor TamB